MGDFCKWSAQEDSAKVTISQDAFDQAKYWYLQAGTVFEALTDQISSIDAARGLSAVHECMGLLFFGVSRGMVSKYFQDALELRQQIFDQSGLQEDREWIAIVNAYLAKTMVTFDLECGEPYVEDAIPYLKKLRPFARISQAIWIPWKQAAGSICFAIGRICFLFMAGSDPPSFPSPARIYKATKRDPITTADAVVGSRSFSFHYREAE